MNIHTLEGRFEHQMKKLRDNAIEAYGEEIQECGSFDFWWWKNPEKMGLFLYTLCSNYDGLDMFENRE